MLLRHTLIQLLYFSTEKQVSSPAGLFFIDFLENFGIIDCELKILSFICGILCNTKGVAVMSSPFCLQILKSVV